MSELIQEINGGLGKVLKIYDDKVELASAGGAASYAFGAKYQGAKEIYYQDITSIQFKNIDSLTNRGYVEFEYPGSHGTAGNGISENAFQFSFPVFNKNRKWMIENMPGIVDDLKKRVNEAKNRKNVVASGISPADELKKFKELLDLGIVSQEEFDAKKKQLLGL